MSHYIVLETQEDGANRVVSGMAFTAVPGGNNSAGVPWTDVIKSYRVYRNRRYAGVTTQAAIPVDPAVQAELDAGTLYEWRWAAVVPTSATNPEAVVAIEAAVNTLEAAEIARVSEVCRYWGFEGDS